MQVIEAEKTIGSDHPALAGHFPGNPVVPGVVILDCVAQALSGQVGSWKIRRIPTTKFVAPLLAEQRMHILITLKSESMAAFECRVDERLIAQGRFELQRDVP